MLRAPFAYVLQLRTTPANHKEDAVTGVPLMHDYVVSVKMGGTPLKHGKCTLQSFISTERFEKIYRGIWSANNNLVARLHAKNRLAKIKIGHCYPRTALY